MSDPSWFHSEARLAALEAEAARWIGTPFRANAAVRGRGVCCHLLAAEIYAALGAIPARAYPPADPNHSIAQREGLIEPFVEEMEGIAAVEGPPLPGDLLGYRIGGCLHHLAIALRGPEMIHAVRHYGVVTARWDDPMWARRLARVWRVAP